MGTLIDSSVLIAWERNQLNLEDQLADSADEDFGVSAITASELLHGVHRASTAAQRRRREAFVEACYRAFPLSPSTPSPRASMHACPPSSRLKAAPSVHTI